MPKRSVTMRRNAHKGASGQRARGPPPGCSFHIRCPRAENLEANLRNLPGRLGRGGYRAQPVRRACIDKADGSKRPLGVPAAALDAIIETYETRIGPHNGAAVVARAWTDPAFRQWLLTYATAAIASMSFGGRQGEHMVAVENTP